MQKPEIKSIALNLKQLEPGDIIIVTDTRDSTTVVNTLIRSAQYAQHLLFNKGHHEGVHAAIVARDELGALKIVDVTGKGILCKDIEEKYSYNMFVYRCGRKDLAMKAAEVAYEAFTLYHKKKDQPASINGDKPGTSSDSGSDEAIDTSHEDAELKKPQRQINYSRGMTVHAMVFPVLVLPHHFNSESLTLDTFCSKFVIECFQVAQHRLAKTSDVALGEEIRQYVYLEKTSTVKSLENYLIKHKGFCNYIVPSQQKNIYSILIKGIMAGEIFHQKGSAKTRERAIKAEKVFNDMTKKIAAEHLLDRDDIKHFDLAVLVMREVFKHLPDTSKILTTAYEYGFEEEMLQDSRLTELYLQCFETREAVDMYGEGFEFKF